MVFYLKSLPRAYLQYSHFNWALGSARFGDLDWRCSQLAFWRVQYIAEVFYCFVLTIPIVVVCLKVL